MGVTFRHTWRSRQKKAASKQRKLAILKRLAGRKAAGRLHIAGVMPTGTYGAEIVGAMHSDLESMQKQWVASVASTSSGSRKATLLLKGDPSHRFAVAALLRYHKEVWKKCGPCGGEVLALPFLWQCWEVLAASPPKTMPQARGPLGIAWVECKRIGWSWPSPFVLEDDRGFQWALTKFSPGALRVELEETRRRQLRRQLGQKLSPDAQLPISEDLVASAMCSRQFSGRDKAVIAEWFCDNVWTDGRWQASGYLVSPMCHLCGAAVDTVRHRLLGCQAVQAVEARSKFSRAFLKDLADLDEDTPPLLRGWAPDPTHDWPNPDKKEVARCQRWCADQERWVDLGEAEQFELDGELYVDGSCFPHAVKRLWRAGWAVVQVAASGQPLLRLFGPVVSGLAQTAPSAEWLALSMAHRHFAPDPGPASEIFSDCLAVVKGMAGIFWSKPMAVFAGTQKAIEVIRRRIGQSVPVRKVQAQQAVVGLEGRKRQLAQGNKWADEAAKLGAAMHPEPLPSDEVQLGAHIKLYNQLLELVAAMLPLWPVARKRHGQRLDRKPVEQRRACRGPTRKQVVQSGHQWFAQDNGFTCLLCAQFTKSRRSDVAMTQCEGANEALKTIIADNGNRGHLLQALSWKGNISLACVACGRWCFRGRSDLSSHPFCLAKRGADIGQKGRENIRRMERNMHPNPRWQGQLDFSAPLCRLAEIGAEDDQTADTMIEEI